MKYIAVKYIAIYFILQYEMYCIDRVFSYLILETNLTTTGRELFLLNESKHTIGINQPTHTQISPCCIFSLPIRVADIKREREREKEKKKERETGKD